MDNAEIQKRMAGEKASELVADGMVVGLGTGSTVHYTVLALGRMAREGLKIVCIPTSKATEKLAVTNGLRLSTLDEHPAIDITIDGADEVTPRLDLIKGMGGALFREKVVASASRRFVIVADESKFVRTLGSRSPLPVEVLPFALSPVLARLEDMCNEANVRTRDGFTYFTDNGNNIVDCRFGPIHRPAKLEAELNSIPGVVENGLFLGMAERAVLGTADGVRVVEKPT